MSQNPEAKRYEEELHEWAIHQRPGPIRGAITSMEYTEDGVVLTVAVKFPPEPEAPEDLVKAPEEAKEKYHHAMVAYWRREYSVSCLKLGPVTLTLPEGINPFLREIVEEEMNWEAHKEKEAARKASATPAKPAG